MRFSNRLNQSRGAEFRINRQRPQHNGEGIMKEGKFYNQVVDGTMKAGRIILIGLTILQRKMRIRVIRHQRMDCHFRRDRQRKERQQKSC